MCDKVEYARDSAEDSDMLPIRGGCEAGYRMIESLDIHNFRCFEKVSLKGLKRVNVITGSNASGKTALLEAVYLGARASGDAVLTLNNMRGLTTGAMILGPFGMMPMPQAALTVQGHFDHYFRSKRANGEIKSAEKFEINYTDTEEIRYALAVYYKTEGGAPIPVIFSPAGPPTSNVVIFDRSKTGKVQEAAQLPITIGQNGQLQHPPIHHLGPATFIFGPVSHSSEPDNVMWFSQLKEKNGASDLINFFSREFPFIDGLEILAPSGANGIYAILKDGMRRRLSVVSSGIYKIMSALLACEAVSKGIILIDEIENGIYYEKYEAIWKTLYQFAEDTGNQVFVTSHSDECLKALPDAIGDKVDDFCLLRTERENGACVVRYSSGTSMKAALQGSNEIRGASFGAKRNNGKPPSIN
jgi:hypothetical protein